MLSSTSKYALRVLVSLHGTDGGRFVRGVTLAERTLIPPNYLSKVLVALRNGGLVETIRGRNGGYRLARASEDIRLIEAVELFEGFRSHPSCLLGIHTVCSDEKPCSAHASFRDVRRAYIAFLETTSIADAASLEEPGLGDLSRGDPESGPARA